jgi:peptidyl-prolyl cis-trans isomerase B (cyclophilin B)
VAKKTKRVEKWRAAAAEQQATGGARRAQPTMAGARRAGASTARRRQPQRRLPVAWIIAGVLVVAAAAAIIIYAVSQGDDEDTQLAAVDQTQTAISAMGETTSAAAAEVPPLTYLDPNAVADVAQFGAAPTQPGAAMTRGDVASGCWTEDQRTTGGTQPLQWAAPPATVLDPAQTYTAQLVTNYGTIVWQLLPQAGPGAANNFACLALAGYYDGAPFHRIVDGFVIQGGDPTGTGTGGPGYGIPDEALVGDYAPGMVSMARTAQPNSSGSQFFINTSDNTQTFAGTQYPYINFARVIGGQDVVDAIAAVEKQDSGRGEISSPVNPVVLQSVTIFQGGLPSDQVAPVGTPVAGTPVAGTPVATPVLGTPIATPQA